MLLAPPPRFSTTICWPQTSDSRLATMRATASVLPPGANGTISRTARLGQACATAARPTRPGTSNQAALSRSK
jgi:hypothetical protein